MTIPFVQYLRPDGRKRPVDIDRPQLIEDLASVVHMAGGRFTCEELTTGEVSVACEFADADIAVEVCPNGPEVGEAVDRMVKRAYQYLTGMTPPDNPDGAPQA